MKVEGPKGPSQAGKAAPVRRTIGTGNFASLLGAKESSGVASSAPTVAASAVGGLMALQGESDAERKKRAKAVNRANDSLTLLDQITYALLNNNVSTAHLARLKAIASVQSEGVTDPRLEAVLDEIDLRLAIETAKLEKAAESQP